jgi:hypothetical protein
MRVVLMFLMLQIPAGRRSVLDAYGEVMLRGWREAVGPCLAEMETNLIQVRAGMCCWPRNCSTWFVYTAAAAAAATSSSVGRGWVRAAYMSNVRCCNHKRATVAALRMGYMLADAALQAAQGRACAGIYCRQCCCGLTCGAVNPAGWKSLKVVWEWLPFWGSLLLENTCNWLIN